MEKVDHNILNNVVLWSAFVGWLVAQTLKLLGDFRRTRRVDFGYFVSTGGMPSAHSAMAAALAVGTGLECGFASPVFAVAIAFASIVMFDAQSVRRAAGLQARLLNQMVAELFKDGHIAHGKLAELLGHTPVEVFAGMIIGGLTAVGLRILMRGAI